MKSIKGLLPFIFLLASVPSFAVTAQITKSATPSAVIVTIAGSGSAYFGLLSADFSSVARSATKTLQGIDWTTTSYPSNSTETVQLCYYRPYIGTPVDCHQITPNSSGTDNLFNNQQFGVGAEVEIRHLFNGGPAPAYPAGKDSVTIRYSY